jgi:hypothetical protein
LQKALLILYENVLGIVRAPECGVSIIENQRNNERLVCETFGAARLLLDDHFFITGKIKSSTVLWVKI